MGLFKNGSKTTFVLMFSPLVLIKAITTRSGFLSCVIHLSIAICSKSWLNCSICCVHVNKLFESKENIVITKNSVPVSAPAT